MGCTTQSRELKAKKIFIHSNELLTINQSKYINTLKWMNNFIHSSPKFEILVNTNISILGFYGYIKNIGGYFDKNIDNIEMVQNSCKCLENFQKKNW